MASPPALSFWPFPFSGEVLHAFLDSVTASPDADALLAAMIAHAEAHNPEALDYLSAGCDSLREALLSHPAFFSSGEDSVGLLARIAALAAPLHEHFPRGLPLLLASPDAIALPRPDVACLLACMFLCALPRPHEECNQVSFAMLFGLPGGTPAPQKLLCVLHYFERILAVPPRGTLALQRVASPLEQEAAHDFFAACTAPVLPMEVLLQGSIHDAKGCLQADFANKYIGGGVLGGGCVQEEIMFSVAPENLVSLLLVPVLGDREALLIAGAERFSAHRGYAGSFAFAGDFVEDCGSVAEGEACGALTPGSARTALVGLDAIPFPWRQPQASQLRPQALLREMVKASAAFGLGQAQGWPAEVGLGATPPIATGNWGCGAFNGAW